VKKFAFRPLKGWRAFAGEVGVIVLGVLLALGAQQAVENWQVRKDVAAFRETINREIGYTLYAQEIRLMQVECSLQRLREIEEWLAQSRSGEVMPPIEIPGGLRIAPFRAAWESRDAQTYRNLPAEVRQQYALFYDGDANFEKLDADSVSAWRALARFSEPGTVSVQERRDARAPIRILKGWLGVTRQNTDSERKIARKLGIAPTRPPVLTDANVKSIRECPPIVQSSKP